MRTSRRRLLIAALGVAGLGLVLPRWALSQEQISKEKDAGQPRAEGAGIGVEVQTAESDVVVLPQLKDRLVVMGGGTVLFGGLALLVDLLRRRADVRAGLDRTNAI